ncbi:MAG TPA: serine/threonine-protein kinase [Myxococcales bacterium]|nr:serine/threonine-protein kinase [Myxococcales bacterium]
MARCLTCETTYPDDTAFCPRDGTALGDRLLENRYRILSKLGMGGMGTVYVAEHVALGKRVAVKVLKEEVSRDPSMAKRFEQEAVAASRIGQENIVDVTDFGRTPEGSLYFVMEYLEGRTLADLLQRERVLPVGRACSILAQICEAIEAAHARGIVHRDLKPHNIVLLDRPGHPDFVKVLDFGISKMGWRQEPITEQGAILGTPEYMAPEQASGESVDPRTDIYALGVMAYELVTGTLPFRGDHSVATMLKHINEAVEPPRHRRPDLGIPEELEQAILKALSKKADDRPQTVTQLRLAIARHIGGPIPLSTPVANLPNIPTIPGTPAHLATPTGVQFSAPATPSRISAPHPAVFTPVPQGSRAPGQDEPFADTLYRVPRRSPWPLLGALGGLGAIAGVAVLLATGRSAPGPEPVQPPATVPVETATPVAVPAPAPPPPAAPEKLAVRSMPEGATVFRGSEKLGQTPMDLERPAATTDLRFELAGHEPQVRRVMPEEAQVDVTLVKRRGKRQSRDRRNDNPKQPFDQAEDLKANPF